MDRGVKTLLRILAAAAILGLLVIAGHPAYRGTASAMWRGRIAASPIWHSNRNYYPQVTFEEGAPDELAE